MMDNPTHCVPVSTAWAGAGAEAAVTEAAAAGGRTALVAGASGLVGREILQGLLADEEVAAVHTLGRRSLPLEHSKLTQHIVDFRSLPWLPDVQEVYLALGTTLKTAGSRAAFRAVDFDASLAVARAARAQGASKLGLVSAMGADPHSGIFYTRVKGELEQALTQLGYSTLVFAQPSFLTGDRASLGQPVRAGEKLALAASRLLAPFIPGNYQAIEAATVARVLLRTVRDNVGEHPLTSGRMKSMDRSACASRP